MAGSKQVNTSCRLQFFLLTYLLQLTMVFLFTPPHGPVRLTELPFYSGHTMLQALLIFSPDEGKWRSLMQ